MRDGISTPLIHDKQKKNSIENHRLMFSLELFSPPAPTILFSVVHEKNTQQALAQQEFNEKIISVRFFARRLRGENWFYYSTSRKSFCFMISN